MESMGRGRGDRWCGVGFRSGYIIERIAAVLKSALGRAPHADPSLAAPFVPSVASIFRFIKEQLWQPILWLLPRRRATQRRKNSRILLTASGWNPRRGKRLKI